MSGLEGGYQQVVEKPTILKEVETKDVISETTQKNITDLKEDYFKGLTYEQLDKLKLEDRLQFITLGKIDAKNLKPGSKIIFYFPNNKKLYNKTSASFIFPSNILAIEAGGKIFRREKGKGEFFNKKGIRLIIGDSSNLTHKGYSVVEIDKVKKKRINELQIDKRKKQQNNPEDLSDNILTTISNVSDLNNLNIGSEIEFNFNLDKNLYIKTSAGSIIPKKFRYIKTIDGKIWIKNDTKGEFFNKEGRRLAIGDKKFTRGYSTLEIISEAEVSKVSTYSELLKLHTNYRLQNVSSFEGNSNNIKEGTEVKFEFKSGDLSNSSLGEVMPIEIRSVIDLDGKVYTRSPVNRYGEFLDIDMNRLKIKNGDSIKIGLIEYPEVIENKIKQHNEEIKSKDYIEFIHTQIKELSNEYGVPEKYVYSLLKGENQFWDYTLKVFGRDNTAYGLLQMTNDTWSKWGKGLDRLDPTDQLRAGIKYMKYIQVLKSCDWLMAMTLYHTGPSILRVNSKNIARNLKWNPGIRSIIEENPGVDMNNVTAKNYLDGAYEYYKRKLV